MHPYLPILIHPYLPKIIHIYLPVTLIDKENAIKYVKRSMEELKSNIFNWLLPLCVLLISMLCLTSIGLLSPELFKFFYAITYCIIGYYFLFLLLIKVFNPERVLK